MTEIRRKPESQNQLHNIYNIIEHFPAALAKMLVADNDIYTAIILIQDDENNEINTSPIHYLYVLQRAIELIENDEKNIKTALYMAMWSTDISEEVQDQATEWYYDTLLAAIQEKIELCNKIIPTKVDEASTPIKTSLYCILKWQPPRSDVRVGDIKKFFSKDDNKTLDILNKNILPPEHILNYTPSRTTSLTAYEEVKTWSVISQDRVFGNEFNKIDRSISRVDAIAENECIEAFREMYNLWNDYKKHMSKYNPNIHTELLESDMVDQYWMTTKLIADTDEKLQSYIHTITPETVYMMRTDIKNMFQILDDDGESTFFSQIGSLFSKKYEKRTEDPEEERLEKALKASIIKLEKIWYISNYISLRRQAHALDTSFANKIKSLNNELKEITNDIQSRKGTIGTNKWSIKGLDEKESDYPANKKSLEDANGHLEEKIKEAKLSYEKIKNGYSKIDDDGGEERIEALIDQYKEQKNDLQWFLKDIDKEYENYVRHLPWIQRAKLSLSNWVNKHSKAIKIALFTVLLWYWWYTWYTTYISPTDHVEQKIEELTKSNLWYTPIDINIKYKNDLYPSGKKVQSILDYYDTIAPDSLITNPLPIRITEKDLLEDGSAVYIYTFTWKDIPPMHVIETDSNAVVISPDSNTIKKYQKAIDKAYKKISPKKTRRKK